MTYDTTVCKHYWNQVVFYIFVYRLYTPWLTQFMINLHMIQSFAWSQRLDRPIQISSKFEISLKLTLGFLYFWWGAKHHILKVIINATFSKWRVPYEISTFHCQVILIKFSLKQAFTKLTVNLHLHYKILFLCKLYQYGSLWFSFANICCK